MSRLQLYKEKSKKRREVLAQQLGAKSGSDLALILGNEDRRASQNSETGGTGKSGGGKEPEAFVVAKATLEDGKSGRKNQSDTNETGGSDDDVEIEDYFSVLKAEEDTYKGSKTFLKGTQSANPHNDYSQHFVDTGQRPQNFIRDSGLAERFEEYPKLKELIRLKDDIVLQTATPPMYLRCDLREFDLAELGCKFDVIIIEPPLEEYQRLGVTDKTFWMWEMIEQLNIPAIADWRCFIWLWCGSADGLSWGRRCLRTWGFRRCEDICWIKTNHNNPKKRTNLDPNALFQRTKEHCLMGIKGTVRRSDDGDFIHANVDIDLIIAEESPDGSSEKPVEIFLLAEHFCLGRRRLHIFGRDDTIRPGWLTIGPELTSSNFDTQLYRGYFEKEPGLTTGSTDKIEQLRPKSPTQNRGGGGGAAGGSGVGQNSAAADSQSAAYMTSGGSAAQPPLKRSNSGSMSGGRGRAGWGASWAGGKGRRM